MMLERLKTRGPLWGPRDPIAPQEEELERLRRDNLKIGMYRGGGGGGERVP